MVVLFASCRRFVVCGCSVAVTVQALSNNNHSHNHRSSEESRRTLLWKAPLGAVGLYGYGRLVYNAVSIDGMAYPDAHERRVAATMDTALSSASSIGLFSAERPFRILEVGIGTDARLIRRGLYHKAFRSLSSHNVQHVEFIGLDIQRPKQKAREAAVQVLESGMTVTTTTTATTDNHKNNNNNNNISIAFSTIQSSIESVPQIPDNYFDSIVCCLTLCSVDDPVVAVREMKRLLRPGGGTLAYVEHVAVPPDDDETTTTLSSYSSYSSHSWLRLQQTLLDPVQQRIADNCHLHRSTEATIASVFRQDAKYLERELFYVESMWPVSCQCRGVLQKV